LNRVRDAQLDALISSRDEALQLARQLFADPPTLP